MFNTYCFGLFITILFFNIGLFIHKKFTLPIFNPLLIGVLFSMAFLYFFNIPLEYYRKGGDLISFFLPPATIALSLSLYRQLPILKKNFLPIIIGCLVGNITSIISVIILSKFLNIDYELIKSFIPKSITTPLGMELSILIGGIPSISIFSILFSGIVGNILAPNICKYFKIKHPISRGLSIGVSSHGIGTAKAIEMGEIEGAISALSIVISGLFTFLLAPFLVKYFL